MNRLADPNTHFSVNKLCMKFGINSAKGFTPKEAEGYLKLKHFV